MALTLTALEQQTNRLLSTQEALQAEAQVDRALAQARNEQQSLLEEVALGSTVGSTLGATTDQGGVPAYLRGLGSVSAGSEFAPPPIGFVGSASEDSEDFSDQLDFYSAVGDQSELGSSGSDLESAVGAESEIGSMTSGSDWNDVLAEATPVIEADPVFSPPAPPPGIEGGDNRSWGEFAQEVVQAGTPVARGLAIGGATVATINAAGSASEFLQGAAADLASGAALSVRRGLVAGAMVGVGLTVHRGIEGFVGSLADQEGFGQPPPAPPLELAVADSDTPAPVSVAARTQAIEANVRRTRSSTGSLPGVPSRFADYDMSG